MISYIAQKAEDHDVIIAVGSGTINDLCKYASYKHNKDYFIYATAPSMNGYLSANASIIIDGISGSYQAHLPKGLFMDLAIIKNAPNRLIASGVADVLCSYSTEKDWLFSHTLLETYYTDLPFKWLKEERERLLDSLDNIFSSDEDAIRVLCNCLIISGLGMYYSGGSYPASQSEHILAHYLTAMEPELEQEFFHGEIIAVTTLTMLDLQEKIYTQKKCPIFKSDILQSYQKNIRKLKKIQKISKKELNFKIDALQRISEFSLQEKWEKFQNEISSLKLASKDLRICFQMLNLPTKCGDIFISRDSYQQAIEFAPLIRGRFTVLDVNVANGFPIGDM